MTNEPNDEMKNQVYLSYRQFCEIQDQYTRGYFTKSDPNSLLISAKSFFIKQKYQDCINILNKITKDVNTKILYQRQALLFKATYLLNPQDFNALQRIIADYDRSRNRCPGKPLTDFHHNKIKQLLSIVIEGRQRSLHSKQIDKQKLSSLIKVQQKKTKYEGMPSYIISTSWSKSFSEFVLKNGPYPGPMTNFQIMNHIFQLEPHQNQDKQYMDTIMFPLIQQSHYYVLGKKHWQILYQVFSGTPIKRVFINHARIGQLSGGDNLVKTIIQYQNEKIIMQWLYGTFWDKSVLPILYRKYGEGQLKELTRNNQFVVVQPGKIQQSFTHLKYVQINSDAIKAIGQKENQRKKKVISYFDLQKFNPDQYTRNGTVGLVNLGNTCYMNSGLQFLTSLRHFSNYFATNRYLNKVNLTSSNKDGSYGMVTCAYADLTKRLWFSSDKTRYIDPTMFKRVFSERYSMFQGNQQQDAQQFLMFMLNCIHQDLNEKAQINLSHRESLGGKAFDNVRNTVVNHYNRHNKSIISDLFHGFTYEEIVCESCQFTTYRFENYLMLHIQAPPDAPRITAFVVQQNTLTEAKRLDIYIKKISKVGDAIDIVRKYFSIKPQNDLIPFIYSDDPKQWVDVDADTNISFIPKIQANNCYFFIHEVRPPEPDEQIVMISYENKSRGKTQFDGFPRLLSLKKAYKQQQYEQQLLQIVFQTIPKTKFERQKKQYIKKVTSQKAKRNKPYKHCYTVQSLLKLSNFDNTNINKVLGDNDLQQAVSLEGLLQKMRKRETIQENQHWNCEKCRQIRKANKTDRIYSASKYLIIQLKRFTENGKITTKIDYPIRNLDMKPFIEQDKHKKASIYNLQAVILHRGSLNSGHYTCICRNSNKDKWLYYDDEFVREIQQENVVDCNAYMLVYERLEDMGASYISIQSNR